MNEHDFELLLQKPESDTLDFKRSHYDFGATDREVKLKKRGQFAKDILAMKNTPRTGPAYIVLGAAKQSVTGQTELCPLTEHIDDAELQQQLADLVYPHPKFHYIAVTYRGEKYAVIEIPENRAVGPCYPTQDVGQSLLRRNVMYWRRGSMNSEADASEQKAIHAWFFETYEGRVLHTADRPDWDSFVSAVDNLDPGRRYLLALSPDLPADRERLANIGLVDWVFVADFSPDSDLNGILSVCRSELEARRSLHLVTKDDSTTTNPTHATQWYFARGLTGRDSTLSLGRWKDWLHAYGTDLLKQLASTAAASTKPATLLAMWNDSALTSHLSTLLQSAAQTFGDAIKLVVVSDDVAPYKAICQELDATLLKIPCRQLLDGLGTLRKTLSLDFDASILLPARAGIQKLIDLKDFAWLEEELEVVHWFIGSKPSPGRVLVRDFLRGHPITWFELGLPTDVEREKYRRIQQVIRQDLELRNTSRINLYHLPGAGGSTLAKRLLWNFHREYPTVVLKRCEPAQTVERLARVFAWTEKPLLILREGNAVSDGRADDLYELLAARNIPCVVFQVLRRYSLPPERERSINLAAQLTTAERERFRTAMSREAPPRKKVIDAVLDSNRPEERTPFFVGLAAFDADFVSLVPYVEHHLAALPQIQNEILVYFSIAHVYGQRALPAQILADILQIPHNRRVNLRKALGDEALNLLVEVFTWHLAHTAPSSWPGNNHARVV